MHSPEVERRRGSYSALILAWLKDLEGVWTSLENRTVSEEDIKRHVLFRCDLVRIGVRNFDHRFTDQLFKELATEGLWHCGNVNVKVQGNRNETLLNDFVAYCKQHPGERFWQALRNWSGQP